MSKSQSAKAIVTEIDSMISFLETSLDGSSQSQTKQQSQSSKSNNNQSQQPKQQKKKKKNKGGNDDEKKYDPGNELNQGRIAGTNPNDCSMDINKRIEIAASVGEECITKEELKTIFEKTQTRPIAYDGFEPSGRMHIAQGILKAINVNKLTSVGCDFVFWVADWFALLNNKMGGDIEKIRIVGKYMIEVWKAAGMDMDNVYFRFVCT